MINWKAVIIGFILAIVLAILFGVVAGTAGSYLGIIIAGIVVGYMVNKDIINGITHGALIGVIAGIILAILILIIVLTVGGALGALIAAGGAIAIIISIIIWTVFGAIGGAIGAIITGRSRQMRPMAGRTEIETTEKSSKIEFNRENILKCACPQCQVQSESDCAQTKMKMLQESMKGMSPEPSDVPGMYCATGMATCRDLDPSKMCNCPNCDIFKENNLAQGEPGGYFCQNGKAM